MNRQLLLGLAAAAVVYPGSGRALGILEPSFAAADEYAETYTFVADLDDGSYVQLQLAVSNLGPGAGTGICRALWVPPRGRAFSTHERTGRDEVVHGRDGAGEFLRVGPCRATAGPTLAVEAALDDRVIALRFDRPAAPEPPPDAVLAVGGREHRTELLVAGGRVTATVARAGGSPRSTTGGGYADHSRSLVVPKRLAASWVRFRALRGDGAPALLLAREAQGGGFGPLWRREDAAFRSGGRFVLERRGRSGRDGFVVRFEGAAGRFRIQSDRILFRHDPLAELGLLGKAVSPLVGAAVTYTFRATLSEDGRPDVPGILEVSLAED